MEAVFQKLITAGLKLKPSKCHFFREEIEYLGHIVSGKGISTNPKKVKAVAKWPTPGCQLKPFKPFKPFFLTIKPFKPF